MKKILFLPSLFLVILISCEDNEVTELPKFTPGDVIIKYNIYTPLDSIYSLVDSYNLTFDEILHYSYIINTTPDSINYYAGLLLEKPYLDNNISPPRVINTNGIISAEIGFNSLNDSQAADWFSFKNEHGFQHQPETYTITSYAFLKVPVGQEEYWADKLGESKHLVSASVNHIFHMGP